MTIRFYGMDDSAYGCFSNFAPYPFVIDAQRWETVEHYFQAQKFAGTPSEAEIRRAQTPKTARSMGRSRSRPLRADWEQVKDDVMRSAVFAKFAQHADIRKILLDTGEEPIIENAPRDYYWGCGASGTGKNMLGIILMETRVALRTEDAHGVG